MPAQTTLSRFKDALEHQRVDKDFIDSTETRLDKRHEAPMVPSTLKRRDQEVTRLREFLEIKDRGRAEAVLREGGAKLSVREWSDLVQEGGSCPSACPVDFSFCRTCELTSPASGDESFPRNTDPQNASSTWVFTLCRKCSRGLLVPHGRRQYRAEHTQTTSLTVIS